MPLTAELEKPRDGDATGRTEIGDKASIRTRFNRVLPVRPEIPIEGNVRGLSEGRCPKSGAGGVAVEDRAGPDEAHVG